MQFFFQFISGGGAGDENILKTVGQLGKSGTTSRTHRIYYNIIIIIIIIKKKIKNSLSIL